MAVGALAGTADPDHFHDTYMCANLLVHPPYMNHTETGQCASKPIEALALLRAACGSDQNLDVEDKMVEFFVSDVEEDGLWWVNVEGPGSASAHSSLGR